MAAADYRILTDATGQQLAKDTTLNTLAKDTTLDTLAKDTSVLAIEEALNGQNGVTSKLGSIHNDLGSIHNDLGSIHNDLGSSGGIASKLDQIHGDLDSNGAIAAAVSGINNALAGDQGIGETLEELQQGIHTDLVGSDGVKSGIDAIASAIAALPNATQAAADHAEAAAEAAMDAARNLVGMKENMLIVNNLLDYAKEVTPDAQYDSKIYNYNTNSMSDVSNGKVKQVNVDSNVVAYFVTSQMNSGTTGYPIISYFDAIGGQLGYQFMSTSEGTLIEKQILTIPTGTAYFYVQSRGFTSAVYAITEDTETLSEFSERVDAALDQTARNLDGTNENMLLVNNLLDYAKEISPDVQYDSKIYNYNTNSMSAVGNGKVKQIDIDSDVAAYFVTSRMVAGSTGYPIVSYFDAQDGQLGYEFMAAREGTQIEKQILTIPAGTAYFYVQSRGFNSAIYTVAKDAEPVSELARKVNLLYDATEIEKEIIEPDSTTTGKMYNINIGDLVTVSAGMVKKYTVDPDINNYFCTTSLSAGSTGFALVTYFDSNDTVVGYEYLAPAGVLTSIDDAILNIPHGAAWFYVNGRNMTPVLKKVKPGGGVAPANRKTISILFVGNSLTQDGIAYLPYLLTNYYPEIDFKFYIYYNAGHTLADQYDKMINNTPCDIFSVAENTASWINYSNSRTMSDILANYTFDIVCMQEYFNYKESYSESDLQDWNNCRDYITANYTGENGLEFISLFHAPRRTAELEDVFALTMSGNKLILQKTISDDMLANGIAVYRALSTSIGTLGDGGDLSPGDHTHTQEGLPCLLQTFVAACWVFDRLGVARSVYGCPIRITTDVYNSINVPGPNLGTGVITGTDAQNLTAQEVAIKAYKEGKYIVSNNIYAEE